MGASDDEDHQEKTLSQVYDRLPEGRTALDLLKKKEERDRVGKTEGKASENVDKAQITTPGSPLFCFFYLAVFFRQSPPSQGHSRP